MPKLDKEFFNQQLSSTGILIQPESKIAVAVSGGIDSLVLTLLLHQYAQDNNLYLTTLTVNHNLRPEASQEANYVHQILQKRNICHTILNWQGKKPMHNLQEIARMKRYKLMEDWCLANNCYFLFIAHHLDDQQETFLIRLRKNSSIIGLAGMRPIFYKQKCCIVRPLLQTTKHDLIMTFKDFACKHIEDPSNTNLKYERVFWRSQIQNANNTIVKGQILQSLQNIRSALEKWLAYYLDEYTFFSQLGYVEIPCANFDILPNFWQKTVASYTLRSIGNGNYPPSNQAIEILLNAMQKDSFTSKTLCGIRISRRNYYYLFVREYKKIDDIIVVDKTVENLLWDSRFIVRKALAGTIIKKIGEEGWRQILLRYPWVKSLKISRYALWSLPAIWRSDRIISDINMFFELFIDNKLQNVTKTFKFAHRLPFKYYANGKEIKDKI